MKYILIPFLLYACNNSAHRANGPEVSAERLDTIQSVPAALVATPFIFETAFSKGSTEKVDESTAYLCGITIGKIKSNSGHIIACDPMHIDEYGIPFTQVFPAGEFPVQLSILRVDGEERIAFARIFFSDAPVAKWEFALLPGQSPIPLHGNKMYGYSVDAGVGIFIDEAAAKALDFEKVSSMEAPLFKEMEQHQHGGWRYAMYNFSNYNAAAFTTGTGDGRYATYTGFDAKGNPCRLLTDFGFFSWKQQ